MSDTGWIGNVIAASRPRAIAALLRNFRDLDAAEEAFQEACLRALNAWPRNGPPRDAAAWLIMVARNAGIDAVRKRSRLLPLPPEEAISDLADVESAEAQRLDEADYRDDILRLLFVCCHPDLPATQQIALALRIVSGLSVRQIACSPRPSSRSTALSRARGSADALALVESLAGALDGYFYFHGARGAFLKELGRVDEARIAFDRAIALANTPAEAAHIRGQIEQLTANAAAASRS